MTEVGGFHREERLVVVGQMTIEFAVGEDEEDRVEVDGYDLHDLIASQFCDMDNASRRQRLGKFRVVVERVG